MAGGHCDLQTGALPQLHERWRVAKELLARRCQGRTTLVAHEQGPSKLLFEKFNPSTDCGLANIEPLCSSNEATGRNDLEERSGEFDVHNDIA